INDADLPHGFYLQQREAAARWMHRWLLGTDKVIHEVDPATLPDPISDAELRALSEGDWTQEDLYSTPEGQVLLMDGEKSVFEINAEHEQRLRAARTERWNSLNGRERQRLVRDTIGLEDFPKDVESKSVGVIHRDGYDIEKLVLTRGSSIPLPALAFIPSRTNSAKMITKATLYLHGNSMATDAAPGGPIEALVKQGQIVLAAELRGIGETETGHDKGDYGRGRFGRDVQEIFLAYLDGKSYVGMRARDVIAWLRILQSYRTGKNFKRGDINIIAIGEAAIPALHAAAITPGESQSLTLRNMIRSWTDLAAAPESLNQAVNVVHGALRHYDLNDLIGLAGAHRVFVKDSVDPLGRPIVDPVGKPVESTSLILDPVSPATVYALRQLRELSIPSMASRSIPMAGS
ncbi:MAG: hypothetical protein O3B86_17550, partial [Planctomycetota bacterium]|nr:hypothetical protein [Planctomycetota bacterium]